MTLNIRVGGRYRTRGGGAAYVHGFSRSRRYPFEGMIVGPGVRGAYEVPAIWTAEGKYAPHKDGPYDIVSEIDAEPTAPPAAHPDPVLAERLSSGCPDTVGDEFFAMTVESGPNASELGRYISTCRAISENGKYQWWARLADLLEGLRGAEGSKGDD